MSGPAHTVRRRLPHCRNSDGRPVWEPPIFDYSDMIDQDDYDRRREALLKYYLGDVVKTTKFLDLNIESRLLSRHEEWVLHEARAMSEKGDMEEGFFVGLRRELNKDEEEVRVEYKNLGIYLSKWWDGSYSVVEDEVSSTKILLNPFWFILPTNDYIEPSAIEAAQRMLSMISRKSPPNGPEERTTPHQLTTPSLLT